MNDRNTLAAVITHCIIVLYYRVISASVGDAQRTKYNFDIGRLYRVRYLYYPYLRRRLIAQIGWGEIHIEIKLPFTFYTFKKYGG